MSANGVVGLKKQELEAKITAMQTLSSNIAACANNAGLSLYYGSEGGTPAFVTSKGPGAQSMQSFSDELGLVGVHVMNLVEATMKYLNGAKDSLIQADEKIANAIGQN